MSILDIMNANVAVRSYSDASVDRAVLERLLRAAVTAPTGMHYEPWAFVVVEDRALLARLSEDSKAHTIANADVLPDSSRARLVERASDPAWSMFYGAPALVIVCARPLSGFVDADCWLAAENLMLAASEEGLGACVIGLALGAINTPKWKQALGIAGDVTAYVPIVIGHPVEAKPPKARKAPEIIWR